MLAQALLHLVHLVALGARVLLPCVAGLVYLQVFVIVVRVLEQFVTLRARVPYAAVLHVVVCPVVGVIVEALATLLAPVRVVLDVPALVQCQCVCIGELFIT